MFMFIPVGLAVTSVWKHIHRLSVMLQNGFILIKLSWTLPKTDWWTLP